MDFKKDLLLVDLEATGLDPSRHEIIQLAAVLLDRKTLKEKKFFNAYIKPRHWSRRDPVSMKVNGIKKEWLEVAPDLKTVLKSFGKKFPLRQVVLGYYVGVFDINFLQAAYAKAKLAWPFDYHYFNIWGLFYAYLAKKKRLNSHKDFAGFGIDSMLKTFKIQPAGRQHDALADCRIEADILRAVMKKLS